MHRYSGLVGLVLLASCGDRGGRSFDFSAFEQEVEAWLNETEGIQGVGTIIVHRDEGVVYQRSFGAFTDDRIYLLASSSKMIWAKVTGVRSSLDLLSMILTSSPSRIISEI